MKRLAPLQPSLFFSILTLCGFTIACGSVTLNDPPGITASVAKTQNPLVAQVSVATALGGCPGQAMVEFGPDMSYGRNTAWYPVVPSDANSLILVAGMRPSSTYHMRALVQAQCTGGTNTYTGDDLTFTTGALPALPFPTLTVTRPSPSTTSPENPGIELIDVTTAGVPAFFTDRDANPIWYYDVGPAEFSVYV